MAKGKHRRTRSAPGPDRSYRFVRIDSHGYVPDTDALSIVAALRRLKHQGIKV